MRIHISGALIACTRPTHWFIENPWVRSSKTSQPRATAATMSIALMKRNSESAIDLHDGAKPPRFRNRRSHHRRHTSDFTSRHKMRYHYSSSAKLVKTRFVEIWLYRFWRQILDVHAATANRSQISCLLRLNSRYFVASLWPPHRWQQLSLDEFSIENCSGRLRTAAVPNAQKHTTSQNTNQFWGAKTGAASIYL